MAENMQIEGEIKRGPGRPPLRGADNGRSDNRPDSVREAEEYARAIMESMGDRPYEADEFYIDPSIIPDGWAYQWKATHVIGKENGYHVLELERNGWRSVPASRHPDMMPRGWEGCIEKKGLRLMELPKILVERAEKRHIKDSREVLYNTERQLYETPANTGPRDDPSVMRAINKVGRTIETPGRPPRDDAER